MPTSYGTAFSATDPSLLAPGTSHDSGIRRFRNVFNLATDGSGGTTNALKIAGMREGCCVEGATLTADVSLAAINFSLGTDADPVKYAAAAAGPAANTTLRLQIKPAMLAMDPLDKPEDIKLFPSAALPAAGQIVGSVLASKR